MMSGITDEVWVVHTDAGCPPHPLHVPGRLHVEDVDVVKK